MYQHIQSQTFLLSNGLLDMFRNARAVVIGVRIPFKSRRGYEFRGLREGTNQVVGRGQFKTHAELART